MVVYVQMNQTHLATALFVVVFFVFLNQAVKLLCDPFHQSLIAHINHNE